MKLPINISGVQEDTGEDILDPEFDIEVQRKLILEIDWNKKEDDNVQARTFNFVRIIDRWLRNQKFKKGSLISSHELRVDSHIVTQSPISSTNEIVNVAGVSSPIIEKIQPRRSKRSPSSSTATRVTRSPILK